jgi:hypothetical protein
MKHLFIRTLQIGALLCALALPAFGQESNRGLFSGDLPGGGRIVFFVEGNNGLAAYIFDNNGQQVSIGSASLAADGTFTMTTNTGETITGRINGTVITVTFRGQTFTINAAELFGATAPISGRFKGWARTENGGRHMEVTLLIDSRNNIFLVGKDGTLFGGFGDITLETGHKDLGDRDDDEKHNREKDGNGLKFHANFSVQTSLGTIKGNINLNPSGLHGFLQIGDFRLKLRAFRESSSHQLSNISTRAFVNNTPQGQLIAGFIVTGGAKLVMVRALGPSLVNKGVTDPVLADPTLTLFRDGVQIAQNDNWQGAANAGNIGASGIAPENANESVVLARLEPGAYTAVVRGADNGTGVALVEVYGITVD